MTFEEYQLLDRLNFSRLKRIGVSPKHFKAKQYDTETFALGRAAHVAILEPESWGEKFIRLPDQFSSRRGKEFAAFEELHRLKGATVMTRTDFDIAEACAATSLRSKRLQGHLSTAAKEVTFIGELRGIPVKARLDWAGATLGDLKTVAEIDLGKFFRQCVGLGYLAQFAWYSDVYESATGEKAPPFKAAPIEKRAPHDLCVVRLSDDDIQFGRDVYNGWLDLYVDCMSRDLWPGVSGEEDAEVSFVMPRQYVADDEPEGEGIDMSETEVES